MSEQYPENEEEAYHYGYGREPEPEEEPTEEEKESLRQQKRLLSSADAKIWAEEFVKTVKLHPTIPTDEGTMIGWFANAIMVGYEKARTEQTGGQNGNKTDEGV